MFAHTRRRHDRRLALLVYPALRRARQLRARSRHGSADAAQRRHQRATERRIVVHLRQRRRLGRRSAADRGRLALHLSRGYESGKQRQDALRLGRRSRSAIAPDPHTIVIRLQAPQRRGARHLGMGGAAYPPLPAHLLARNCRTSIDPSSTSIRSRAGRICSKRGTTESLVFVPNPRYFRGRAETQGDRLEDHSRRQHALQPTQRRTRSTSIPASTQTRSRRLSDISGIGVDRQLIANWRHLGINMSRPQLADVRVRRAIAEAVDWKRINDTVYHGINRLAVSDIFPESWAAPHLPPYRYDLGDAKRLLADAGWRAGSDGMLHKGALAMHLTIYATTGHQENTESQVLIQSMLRAVRHRRRRSKLSGQLSFRQRRSALHRKIRSRMVDRNQRTRSR